MAKSKTPAKQDETTVQTEANGIQGITAIAVEGYKAIAENCRIEVRPLTILAGANSSGKSSVMQPLLLMKQTLEATYDPVALLLNGPNLRFTSAEQLFSSNTSRKLSKFSIGIEIDKTHTITNTFHKPTKQSIDLAEMRYTSFNLDASFYPDISHEDLFETLPPGGVEVFNNLVELTKKNEQSIVLRITRNRRLFEIEMSVKPSENTMPFPGFNSPAVDCEVRLQELMHVPGLRGNPERTYKTTAVDNRFPGTFENYVASVIKFWQSIKDPRLKILEEWLGRLGLTCRVEAKQIDDTQVELQVGRLPYSNSRKKDMVNIADVGFGVSQVLPALVSLLAARPHQLVYIEQPEIHLHPRAQVALAEILAEAASWGIRIVAETHSELLLLGIQSLVAEGSLSPDLVKLHWFTRSEDGITHVTSADLDEAGAFGEWPVDFADVAMTLDNRYLSAAEAQLWKSQTNGKKSYQ